MTTTVNVDNAFSVASALYWYCNDWHGGMSSPEYRILSTMEYRPGCNENGVESEDIEALDVYASLEAGTDDVETLYAALKTVLDSDEWQER